MQMHVIGIGFDALTWRHLVVIADEEERRALVVAVGTTDAMIINHAMQSRITAQPVMHDLLVSALDRIGYEITHVELGGDHGDDYAAVVALRAKSDRPDLNPVESFAARPSDAITLALRADVPICVSSDTFDDAPPALEVTAALPEDTEFKKFLEDLKASDFHLDGPAAH